MLQAPLTSGDVVAPGCDPAPRARFAGPWAALLAVIAGGVLVLAFPPTGWWPVASLAVACLAVAAHGRTARTGALLGTLTGLTFFLIHLHWSGVYVGVLPWAALAVLQTVFTAAMGALLPAVWLARDALRRKGGSTDGPPGRGTGSIAGAAAGSLLVVVGTSGLWVAQEALRSRIPFGGFPWGRLAFSQSNGPLSRWAWLGGAPLTTAAVAALGGALAVIVVSLIESGGPRLRSRLPATEPLTALAVLAVVPLGYLLPIGAGWWGGAASSGEAGSAGERATLRVAAVQGNVPEAGLDFNAERRAVLDNHVRGTLELADRVEAGQAERPDLVLWPENSSDIDPLRNPDAAEVITQAADAIGVPILVGAVLREPVGYLSNAGIVWNPSEDPHPGPGVRYVKKHPAPFAEYIPYRAFFRNFSDKVDLVSTDFAPGRLSGALPMGPTTVGDVICFEVAYDGIVQRAVKDGAQLLVVQTNNATFGYTDESVQQLAMSRLRAIETGRAVVHVSTVGVSGIYGPDGTELARSGHFTHEVLQADVPERTGLTPAVRLGAVPETVLALIGLTIAVGGILLTRRSRRGAVRAAMQT